MFASRTIRGVEIPCVTVYVICVIVIIAYGFLLSRLKTRDYMAERVLEKVPEVDARLDWWSVSHLLFFGLLGVLYPGKHLQFLVVGALWEVIESAAGSPKSPLAKWMGQNMENNQAASGYWYGRLSDVLMDMVGYTVGSAWAARYWPPGKGESEERPRTHRRRTRAAHG
jgi:hypothetical protein